MKSAIRKKRSRKKKGDKAGAVVDVIEEILLGQQEAAPAVWTEDVWAEGYQWEGQWDGSGAY